MKSPSDHPQIVEGVGELSRTKDLGEFAKKLNSDVGVDEQDRQHWLERQRYFWRRRYQQEFRNPQFPWPGSSDIVMPTIDMMIDKIRPAFSHLVFGQQRMVSMRPQTADSVENARNAEMFFNWFLQYRCEDLQKEVELTIDRNLQYGHGVFKVYWEHRTSNQEVVIDQDSMPDHYKKVVVMDITDAEADAITQMTGGLRVPVTKEEFKKIEGQVRRMVRMDYSLNPGDPLDVDAENKIIAMLRNPKRKRVTIRKRTMDYSWPKVVSVSPYDIIIPKGTRDLREASRITHRMWFTKEDFEARVRDKKWDEKNAERVLAMPGAGRTQSMGFDQIEYSGLNIYDEGIDAFEDMYEVYETCTWYDIDGDGHKEKCIITYSPKLADSVLSAVPLPYEHGQWPYVKVDFENTSDRYYSSRGVPEKLDDLDVEITAQHRAKLNRMMIGNSPTFKYRAGSDLQPNQMQWIPGQFLPVINMQDIEAIQIPNLDISFDKEEQILRTWAEQYMGGTDFGISGPNSLQDARTAQEIRAIETNRQQVSSARARAFQTGMRKVWDMMWDLIMQYQKNDIFISVTGRQPVKMSLSEIQGNYDIIPEGAVGFNDPVFKSQKAMARLQLLAEIAPMIQANPEDAAKYDISLGAAARNFLEEDDVTQADVIMRVRSPEEQQAIMQQQQQRQQLINDVEDNIPTDPGDLVEYTKLKQGQLPHGRGQRVKQ